MRPDHTLFNPLCHEKLPLDFFTGFQNENEVFFSRYLRSHEQFVNDQFAAVPNMPLFREWSPANPDRVGWHENVKLFHSINRGLYTDYKREDEYLNAFIPLRQQAFNLISNANTSYRRFNDDVYPKLYNLALKYINNTKDKYILLDNPYSLKVKALPYLTRFKGYYLKHVNLSLNQEIPFLEKYKVFQFMTITVNPNMFHNPHEAHLYLSKLWNRVITALKKKLSHRAINPYFVKTFEFQKNGYPHLHILIAGVGYIPWKWLTGLKDMKKQRIFLKYLRGYDYKDAFNYILKYIVKNQTFVDASNENSIIDYLSSDNEVLKEKIISWSSNDKIDYLTSDLLRNNSHFARGRIKEFFDFLLSQNFVSPKNSNHFLKTDNSLTGLSKYRPYQSHIHI